MLNRPKAFIVDVDGTLINVNSVRHHVLNKPKDFDAFHRDSIHCPPNQDVVDWVKKMIHKGYRALVVTGRSQKWLEVTRLSLERYMPTPYDGPFMRPEGDLRPDVQIKREIYNYLSRMYDIRYAIDDNPKIVELWTSLGIPTKVVPGWLEPERDGDRGGSVTSGN